MQCVGSFGNYFPSDLSFLKALGNIYPHTSMTYQKTWILEPLQLTFHLDTDLLLLSQLKKKVTHYFENISFTVKLDVTRQAKYVQHNIETRWCNHCCRIKAISTAYSEFLFVDLGIQHTIHKCHIVICGLSPLYNIFPHIIRSRFSENVIQQ